MESNHYKYIEAIDAITRTLLRRERIPVKELKKELLSKAVYGLKGQLAVYDELLERIVDVLEDGGYLSHDIVIEATQVRLEPIEE